MSLSSHNFDVIPAISIRGCKLLTIQVTGRTNWMLHSTAQTCFFTSSHSQVKNFLAKVTLKIKLGYIPSEYILLRTSSMPIVAPMKDVEVTKKKFSSLSRPGGSRHLTSRPPGRPRIISRTGKEGSQGGCPGEGPVDA